MVLRFGQPGSVRLNHSRIACRAAATWRTLRACAGLISHTTFVVAAAGAAALLLAMLANRSVQEVTKA